jgi:hypothetical protein
MPGSREKADQHAKAALQEETRTTKPLQKTGKERIGRTRQAKWTSSENPMVTVKPRIKKIPAHRHSQEKTRL